MNDPKITAYDEFLDGGKLREGDLATPQTPSAQTRARDHLTRSDLCITRAECDRLVAFRVIKEYVEPREWWVTMCGEYSSIHDTKEAAEVYKSAYDNDVEIVHIREVRE